MHYIGEFFECMEISIYTPINQLLHFRRRALYRLKKEKLTPEHALRELSDLKRVNFILEIRSEMK